MLSSNQVQNNFPIGTRVQDGLGREATVVEYVDLNLENDELSEIGIKIKFLDDTFMLTPTERVKVLEKAIASRQDESHIIKNAMVAIRENAKHNGEYIVKSQAGCGGYVFTAYYDETHQYRQGQKHKHPSARETYISSQWYKMRIESEGSNTPIVNYKVKIKSSDFDGAFDKLIEYLPWYWERRNK